MTSTTSTTSPAGRPMPGWARRPKNRRLGPSSAGAQVLWSNLSGGAVLAGRLAEDRLDLEHDPGRPLGEAAGTERGQRPVGNPLSDLVRDQPAQGRGQGDPAVADRQVQPLQPGQG